MMSLATLMTTMILMTNPIFEEHVDLPGKHSIKEINLKADLSNSRLGKHAYSIHTEYTANLESRLFFSELIKDICQERFLYHVEYLKDKDVTRIQLDFEHVHDGCYEEPLLGARHLTIKTDKGIYHEDVSLSAKSLLSIPKKDDSVPSEREFVLSHEETTYHHVDFAVDKNQKTLVEFWYLGWGDISVSADPIIETDKIYRNLVELSQTNIIKTRSWVIPQKFKMVVPLTGNRVRLRWSPQNAEDQRFKVLVYDLKVSPIYHRQENLNP